MAEPVLKLAPSLKPAKPRAATLTDALRKRMRFILLVVVPVIAVVTGLVFYMMGGRYVSTDDAYVHAAKLMVSTDVSGLVSEVDVREGQTVKAGDVLFLYTDGVAQARGPNNTYFQDRLADELAGLAA